MIPYRGRQAVRIARLVLSIACVGWYAVNAWHRALGLSALLLGVHLLFAVLDVAAFNLETSLRLRVGLGIDVLYFTGWAWLAPEAFPAVWAAAVALGGAVVLQTPFVAMVTAVGVVLLSLSGWTQVLPWTVAALGVLSLGGALLREYLGSRLSQALQHNMVMRSQTENLREVERQRMAGDFHDGPLQNFVGFQMRLEIIRRQLERDPGVARKELEGLQELAKAQVTDLRSFVRTMRPPDEGLGLAD
jgi:signal transduction histidine kinase